MMHIGKHCLLSPKWPAFWGCHITFYRYHHIQDYSSGEIKALRPEQRSIMIRTENGSNELCDDVGLKRATRLAADDWNNDGRYQ